MKKKEEYTCQIPRGRYCTSIFNEITHISNGEKSFVKKQHHPKEEEKYTKPSQSHPNFCRCHKQLSVNVTLDENQHGKINVAI